jgi:hypothetical protein
MAKWPLRRKRNEIDFRLSIYFNIGDFSATFQNKIQLTSAGMTPKVKCITNTYFGAS